jgi:alpha-galactosidase
MDYFRVDAGEATLMLHCAIGAPPNILYWGKRLSSDASPADVMLLGTSQGAPGTADVPIETSLALEPGLGFSGASGFSAHRAGLDWGSRFVVRKASTTSHSAVIECHDERTKISLTYSLWADPLTGLFTIGASVSNHGEAVLELTEMATAVLPIPSAMSQIIGFTGRWSLEFQRERIDRFAGAYVRENRRGRTSHDSFPAIILCESSTNESHGDAYGLHLAWSGNHRIRVDSINDGQVFASLGALLFPGEIRLATGETYQSPDIVAVYSASGLSGLSQKFHHHVRTKVLRPSTRARSRPVHYNTWEAVYFDHDTLRLKELATRAAAIGVERFVLDDGWFGSRRNDRSGLGDWFISDDVYPDGLKPLVDFVTGLGMEMGIWFEPEMVNPDSDLFRAHPDWVLQIEGVEQIAFRNQYVLDIARAEVSDYLFTCIDKVLSDHNIGYIKWDMNRDINHPGDASGRARADGHVRALWALIDRIRIAHPNVEIESCSSGGGRTDYGILARTDRVWTSDTNDAIDRQSIQRGASHFLPLDVMGAHVGPRHCHVTGRTLSMAMRAGTAMIGHMGLELNLLTEPEAELAELKEAIALHKQHRDLLHSGNFLRLDTADYLNAVGIVSVDQSEAIFSVAFVTGHWQIYPERLYFTGLSSDRQYRLRLIWPNGWVSKSSPSIIDALDLCGNGTLFNGDALMSAGLQLPLIVPETVLIFHLTNDPA